MRTTDKDADTKIQKDVHARVSGCKTETRDRPVAVPVARYINEYYEDP